MSDLQQAWSSVLTQLQMDMPRASFETWVLGTVALGLENDVLLVSTRNAYARDWLESRLTSTVQRLLVGILNRSVSVKFVVGDESQEEMETEAEETDQAELNIEPVQWLDYDRIVQPHKQVVVKGYLRRLGMEIGPKAVWLYIGFHQTAWRVQDKHNASGKPLHSHEVKRFSAMSNGAFWRLLKHTGIQGHLTGLVQRVDSQDARRFRRGRDGRPHRAPIRYQVFMTPRLTRADATAVHLRLKALIEKHNSITSALQELLAVEDVMELLDPMDVKLSHPPLNTVMDMVRLETGENFSGEIERLAQELPGRHPHPALLHHRNHPPLQPDACAGLVDHGRTRYGIHQCAYRRTPGYGDVQARVSGDGRTDRLQPLQDRTSLAPSAMGFATTRRQSFPFSAGNRTA